MAIYLEHVSGRDRDKVEVFEGDRVRIGRNPDNDLHLDGDDARLVSRYHAEIYREGEHYFVKDLQSRNGTFVAGRAIDQAVQLGEGEAIQLAAGGPTLRFSTRGVASTGAQPVPAAGPQAAPAAPPLWRRAVVVLGAAFAAALLAGGIVGYLWSSWWVFLGGFAGAAALESVGLLVWTWWRERRGRPAAAGSEDGHPAAPADAVGEVSQRWTEGLNVLKASNLKQGGEGAVYALPWYLVLGDRGSGRTTALRSGRPLPSSPGSRRSIGPTTTFDWWFFEQCVVLDVTGRYMSESGETTEGREWRRFLDLLRRTRRRQPLNGVVITLPAGDLTRRAIDDLQQHAGHVRRRLDEMVRELGIVFPVYVLVTGLDAIAGFTRIFGGLPDGMVDQAMGAANAEMDAPDAAGAVERAFRTIGNRLHALRLATLHAESSAAADPAQAFLFVEEFKLLERPVRAFVEAVFRRSPYQETPGFRGLYFSSAMQNRPAASRLAPRMGLESAVVAGEGPSRAFFARHLFTQILPAERGLVRPTAAWYRRYHGAQLAGILAAAALVLALVLAFTLSFVRNSQALATATVDACRRRTEAPPGIRLVQLDDCREAIESLTPRSWWARISTDFGLRHVHLLQGFMRTRYVEAAKRDAIEPQEARIDAKLTAGAEAPAYVAALVDRIQLIGRCRVGGCATLDDWTSPRYAAMIAADRPDLREPTVAMMARTEAAYLRWQPDVAALDELRGADFTRVNRWVRAGGLRPEWFLASASSRFPPVRMKDFWGVDGPAGVDGAYTARAWHDALSPLVSGLRAITNEQPEAAAALSRFEADYRRDGQRQWQAFLEAFPQGERLAAGRRADRDFAGWMVKPDSPYRRLLEAVVTNVTPLAPEPQADAPSWVRTVTRYAALRARLDKLSPEEQKALKQREREAAASLTGYGEASEQLGAEMTPPERAYRSALRVFDEGEPSARSTHPVQKALWAVRNLRGALPGAESGDDGQFWLLFTRPIELTWRAILDQAGVHLQQQWEAMWPELAGPDTAPAQRASRVIGFVNDRLAAVLDLQGNRYVPRRMFGAGIPFRPDFLDYLASARQFQPTGPARLEPPRQIVSIF